MTPTVVSGPADQLNHLDLDCAVALARKYKMHVRGRLCHVFNPMKGQWSRFTPCASWKDAGPLMAAYRPSIMWPHGSDGDCRVTITRQSVDQGPIYYGQSHAIILVALCRAVVLCELGTFVNFSVDHHTT